MSTAFALVMSAFIEETITCMPPSLALSPRCYSRSTISTGRPANARPRGGRRLHVAIGWEAGTAAVRRAGLTLAAASARLRCHPVGGGGTKRDLHHRRPGLPSDRELGWRGDVDSGGTIRHRSRAPRRRVAHQRHHPAPRARGGRSSRGGGSHEGCRAGSGRSGGEDPESHVSSAGSGPGEPSGAL